MSYIMTVTKEQLTAILTEWEKRARQNPEDFVSPETLTAEECGERAADYICRLHVELFLDKQD